METFESFLVCRDGIAQKNAKNRIALAGLDCSTLFNETDFIFQHFLAFLSNTIHARFDYRVKSFSNH